NSQVYLNLTGLKLAGIVMIPFVIKEIKELSHSKFIKFLFIFFGIMVVLGIVYGFIFPWPDSTGERSIRDLPAGRSVLHLGSVFLEFAVAIWLGLKFKIKKNQEVALKALFYSTVLAAGSMYVEFILSRTNMHFDFYHFFTGGRAYHVWKRMRGFMYEPRGASQICAYGFLLLLIYFKGPIFKKIAYGAFFLIAGFALTFSMTGLITLVAATGILVTLKLFLHLKKIESLNIKALKIYALAGFIGLVSLIAIINISPKSVKWEAWKNNFRKRSFLFNAQSIAGRLEVFDAAAVNFFTHNPKHLIIGTGPGLVGLPASPYILDKDRKDFPTHISALPHMGGVIMLSNVGLLGLLIWFLMFWKGAKTNFSLIKLDPKHTAIFLTYILFMLLYLLQIRYFYLFGLGLGIGASLYSRSIKK
ncbi:hypothetical protein N9N67_06355, partial [Bacteriovoracaceae bacterium]|nr:hypothetical protein [Bacteriovoracaceae bacterium]